MLHERLCSEDRTLRKTQAALPTDAEWPARAMHSPDDFSLANMDLGGHGVLRYRFECAGAEEEEALAAAEAGPPASSPAGEDSGSLPGHTTGSRCRGEPRRSARSGKTPKTEVEGQGDQKKRRRRRPASDDRDVPSASYGD